MASTTPATWPCSVCKKPGTLKCGACPETDPTRYCSKACQISHWHPGHRINCKIKQLYAQIRELVYPQQLKQINDICMLLLQMPFENVDPTLHAYLRDVPPSNRGVALGGTNGIAGIESQDLMDGMDRIGKESIDQHEARVMNMRSLGLYKNTPKHLVPFADCPCQDVESSEDGGMHTGITHYPQDYDMLSFTLYTYHWRAALFDDNYFSIKDPWAASMHARRINGDAMSEEELDKLVEEGKLTTRSAKDMGLSNAEMIEMLKSMGAAEDDLVPGGEGMLRPRGHIIMA